MTVLPEGLDPDDVARKDPELFRRLLAEATPLLEFLIDRVRDASRLDRPEGQLRFLQRTAALIAEEPDPVRREVYLSKVAGSAGVDPAFLREKLPAAGKSTEADRPNADRATAPGAWRDAGPETNAIRGALRHGTIDSISGGPLARRPCSD